MYLTSWGNQICKCRYVQMCPRYSPLLSFNMASLNSHSALLITWVYISRANALSLCLPQIPNTGNLTDFGDSFLKYLDCFPESLQDLHISNNGVTSGAICSWTQTLCHPWQGRPLREASCCSSCII